MSQAPKMTLKDIKVVLEEFERQHPKSKVPSYCYASKRTIQRIKIMFNLIIIHGNPTMSGVPIYEPFLDLKIPPEGEIHIYNVCNDLMEVVKI